MDTISMVLLGGICVTGAIVVVLGIVLIIAKAKGKKTGNVDVEDNDSELVAEKKEEKHSRRNKKEKAEYEADDKVPLDISNIELIDPAIQPLLDQSASFISDDTEGVKYEQFDTVAASEVARSIANVHEASGFNIIYTGSFTADTLMYKFYYLQVVDKNAEDGFAYYVLYESGVGASAVFIGESKDEINDVYLANKGGVNL